MKLIYSGMYNDRCHPFNVLAENVEVAMKPDDIREGDSALVIWGGADIHPEYYNHPKHPTTHPGGYRDRAEWGLMQRAIEKGLPIFGVCRGAQMLCAAAGGWLLQDVQHHLGHHEVVTNTGGTFEVNSIHHQMMNWDQNVDAELVCWREGRSGAPYGYRDDQEWSPPNKWKEPEFVYFPKIHGYAIQWHPEGMGISSEATQFVLDFIRTKEKARGEYAEVTVST